MAFDNDNLPQTIFIKLTSQYQSVVNVMFDFILSFIRVMVSVMDRVIVWFMVRVKVIVSYSMFHFFKVFQKYDL